MKGPRGGAYGQGSLLRAATSGDVILAARNPAAAEGGGCRRRRPIARTVLRRIAALAISSRPKTQSEGAASKSVPSAAETVTITADAPVVESQIDRKVYRADADLQHA